jgi:hypothetical protein
LPGGGGFAGAGPTAGTGHAGHVLKLGPIRPPTCFEKG